MNPVFVKTFNKGLITRIEDRDAARGSASDMLNWHVLGDHIELRRGRKLLGDPIDGVGRISGLRVIERYDGYKIPIFTFGRKAYYHDVDTNTNTEIGSDVFPAEVIGSDGLGEDMSIEEYSSLSGPMAYISSPNSSIYKIPAANPGSIVDLLSREYRGKIKTKNSRLFLWDRKDIYGGLDQTGLLTSHVDGGENIYQLNTKEQLGTGDGTQTTFTGTLAFKALNSKETAFFVVVAGANTTPVAISDIDVGTQTLVAATAHGLAVGNTVIFAGVTGMTEINDLIGVVTAVSSPDSFLVNIDSTGFTPYSAAGTVALCERFIDDRSGNMRGTSGGTGTINYATGAYSLTFATPPITGTKILTQYFREDSTRVDSEFGGIANFSYSSPRENGEGNVYRQDTGGKFMSAETYGDSEYCFHQSKTYIVTIPYADDTASTNLPYRDGVGIPYFRAAKATGNGIFYVDTLGEDPAIRKLDYGQFLTNVIPKSQSDALDLRPYGFERAVVYEWGDYIIVACRLSIDDRNLRFFMRHKVWQSWEVHSFPASCMDNLNGALIAGDSGSNNVFKLFSGFTDEDALIENFYITNDDDLNIDGTKRTNRLRIAGYIGIDQGMAVDISVDNGPFVEVGGSDETLPDGTIVHHPVIEGNGSYVDLSQRKLIGNITLGEQEIGGGQAPEDAIYASPYEYEFFVGTDVFEGIRLRFRGTNVGYLSISEYGFVDNRYKGKKSVPKYQQ